MAKMSIMELKDFVSDLVVSGKVSNANFIVSRSNVAGLLDKIGKIITIDTEFDDPLADLGGDNLEFGKTIEEWQEDLILPTDYDADGSGALTRADGTYRPVFYSYTLGKKKIKTTIPNNDLERAVNNAEQFASLIAMKSKRLYDSEIAYKYEVKMGILGALIGLAEEETDASISVFDKTATYEITTTSGTYTRANVVKSAVSNPKFAVVVKKYTNGDADDYADAVEKGYLIELDLITEIAKPTDATTGEAFIEQVKKDVEVASQMSEGHSLNGGTLGASKSLKLVVKQGIIPNLEVKTMSGAFHLDKLATGVDTQVITGFGDADAKYFAMLFDKRGVKLHETYRAVREQMNADGDFLNLFLHLEHTAFVSRNIFVKIYKEPNA